MADTRATQRGEESVARTVGAVAPRLPNVGSDFVVDGSLSGMEARHADQQTSQVLATERARMWNKRHGALHLLRDIP